MLNKTFSDGKTMSEVLKNELDHVLLRKFDNSEFDLIYNACKDFINMSEEEKKELFKQSAKNEYLQNAIVTHPDMTDEILAELLSNYKIHESSLKYLFFKKEVSVENAKLMTQKLSPAFLIKVFNVNNKLGGANGYFIDGYSDEKINKNVMASICRNAINKLYNAINDETRNSEDIDIHRILSLPEFEAFEKVDFSLVTDEFKILENCTHILTNKLTNSILNNPTITEKTKIFFMENADYDLIYIDKLPQQYIQGIYDANVDNALNVGRKLEYGEHYIATQVLSSIINDPQYGFPYAVDLMKRCLQLDFNPTRLGVSSLSTLMRNTEDKELIRTLFNEIVNSSERTEWFYYLANNPNTPPDILNEIFNKYTSVPISTNEKDALLNCAYRLQLTDEQCLALSKIALIGDERATKNTFDLTFNTQCRVQLLLNETTPIEILKEIANEKKYTDSVITAYGTSVKIKDIVELDEICRKNKIERKKDLFDFFIYSNGKIRLFDISTEISKEDLLFLKEVKTVLEKNTDTISFDTNPIIWEIYDTISNKIDSIETEKGRLEKQLYETEQEFNFLLQDTVRRFQLYVNYDKIVDLYEKRLSLTSALENIEQVSNKENRPLESTTKQNCDNSR